MRLLNLILLAFSVITFFSCNPEEEDYYENVSNPNELTYVPDDKFEQYLEDNNMGNGVHNDHYVFTELIDIVTSLNVDYEYIYDLTGIEDFSALESLSCYYNHLSSLNVTQNTLLEYLDCSVQNPPGGYPGMLTELDVSQNTHLTRVKCYSNSFTSLDFSNNPALIEADVEMNNSLSNLNVQNGNNHNLVMDLFSTNDLDCITVDDPAWSYSNWTYDVDYSLNCQ